MACRLLRKDGDDVLRRALHFEADERKGPGPPKTICGRKMEKVGGKIGLEEEDVITRATLFFKFGGRCGEFGHLRQGDFKKWIFFLLLIYQYTFSLHLYLLPVYQGIQRRVGPRCASSRASECVCVCVCKSACVM